MGLYRFSNGPLIYSSGYICCSQEHIQHSGIWIRIFPDPSPDIHPLNFAIFCVQVEILAQCWCKDSSSGDDNRVITGHRQPNNRRLPIYSHRCVCSTCRGRGSPPLPHFQLTIMEELVAKKEYKRAKAGVSTSSRSGDFCLSHFHYLISHLKIFLSTESTRNNAHSRYFSTLNMTVASAVPGSSGPILANCWWGTCQTSQVQHVSQIAAVPKIIEGEITLFFFTLFLPAHCRIQISICSPGSRRNKLLICQKIAQKNQLSHYLSYRPTLDDKYQQHISWKSGQLLHF